MFDGFINNFRNIIGSPTTVVGGGPQKNVDNKPKAQKVWGFEEDKSKYGNERDGDNMTWRRVVAHNNDTNEDLRFDVGYDKSGKISGVRQWESDTKTLGYYGQDLIGDFFKKNFDRDATDYTIFEDYDNGDGYKYVIFDSKNDGAFIPSQALSSKRAAQGVPMTSETDRESQSFNEALNEGKMREGAFRGQLYTKEDRGRVNSAYNGSILPWDSNPTIGASAYNDFANNRDKFDRMLAEWSLENNPNKRQSILKNYSDKYGFANNRIFNDMLQQLSWHDYGDANDHDHPGANFSIMGRIDWLKDIRKQMDEADLQYNPYKKA